MYAILQTDLPLPLLQRGKVRDIYDAGIDGVLLVSTDRLSAFDVVFDDPIPMKGIVLNQLSAYWFDQTRHVVSNHLLDARPEQKLNLHDAQAQVAGRSVLCRKAKPLPVECVVRGYLEGSAWNDYQREQQVSGIKLPPGLKRRGRFRHPLFTPSTKAASGHDEPISFEEVVNQIGVEAGEFVRAKSIELYQFAHEELLPKGIILSDTKFEFGETDDGIILIDEALTPDSSRFWEADGYRGDADARSLDKQYVRDYVESTGWNKKPPPPRLPQDVVANTTARYLEIFRLITGHEQELNNAT